MGAVSKTGRVERRGKKKPHGFPHRERLWRENTLYYNFATLLASLTRFSKVTR